MEKISINQLVLPILATLLLLTIQTGAVVGKISSSATPSEEEMRTMMDYNKMAAIENFAARMMIMSQRPRIVEVKDEAQNKEIGSVAAEKGLQCVSQGSYCNSYFGPRCCNGGYYICVPWGLVGGVCVA